MNQRGASPQGAVSEAAGVANSPASERPRAAYPGLQRASA